MDVGTATDIDGWEFALKGIEIVWRIFLAVPTACMELTTCSCKTKYSTARCKCLKANQI